VRDLAARGHTDRRLLSRRPPAAVVSRAVTLGLALVLAAAAPARASELDRAAGAIVGQWAALQRPDGSFEGGGGEAYCEAMMGYAMLQRASAERAPAMADAAFAAVGYAIAHGSRANGRLSVFEDMALAAAWNLALRDWAGAPGFQPLRDSWWRALAALTPIAHRRYDNHALVDLLANVELERAGLPAPHSVGWRRAVLRRIDANAHAYATRVGGRRAVVFSDPPSNPIAYQALTLGVLARIADRTAPRTPAAILHVLPALARGSAALVAPDGDVAYWGRSQEQPWALAFAAQGAAAVARREPSLAPLLRPLYARALRKLVARHFGARSFAALGSARFLIAPSFAQSLPGEDRRLGLDAYTAPCSFAALTAVALSWAAPPAAGPPLPSPLKAVLSGGDARFAVVRDGATWFAVKEGRRAARDARYGYGIVAAKHRVAGRWREVVGPRPFDYRQPEVVGVVGPALIGPRGAAPPAGSRLRVRGRRVLVDTRWAGKPRKPVTVVFGARSGGGVAMRWRARAGQRFALAHFVPTGGAPCWTPHVAGNAERSLATNGRILSVAAADGYASPLQRHLTRLDVKVRAARDGALVVAFRPGGC